MTTKCRHWGSSRRLGQEGRQVRLDRRVRLDLLGFPVLEGRQVRLGRLGFLVRQVGRQVHRDRLGFPVRQVGRQVRLVLRENPGRQEARPDLQVLRVPWVLQVRQDLQGHQDLRGHPDRQDHLAHPDRRVSLELERCLQRVGLLGRREFLVLVQCRRQVVRLALLGRPVRQGYRAGEHCLASASTGRCTGRFRLLAREWS